MFSWYAREFHTVEINNSFYRLPERKTFTRWKELSPPGFVFAVKASRFITHIKRLKDVEDSIELLFSRLEPLGSSLGPVLFQLPPKLQANIERLSHFVSLLPRGGQYAIEFRDQSWSKDEIYEILRRRNVALCIHDWREMAWPAELTADFTYMRFHGSGSRYGGDYPRPILKKWARRIRSWQPRLSRIFIYFNNDIGGHAVRNARCLRQLLEVGEGRSRPDVRGLSSPAPGCLQVQEKS
ncbi:MAG: DUF72 domain-containing protein [Acidobacteria bacterium]|nr:DUF72 domain-containing protein [Acidobacteriota bacterium]